LLDQRAIEAVGQGRILPGGEVDAALQLAAFDLFADAFPQGRLQGAEILAHAEGEIEEAGIDRP
jgi:hypothetical protein